MLPKILIRLGTLIGFILVCHSATAQVRQAWLARYAEPGDDYVNALVVDSAGNVYVTGQSSGGDYATIKYDANGGQVWLARYNGPGSGGDHAKALAVDRGGNVYVTGASYSANGGGDYATVKYDANGNQIWVARYDGPCNGEDFANALALDSEGNVYVTGRSCGADNRGDYATIKYDANGDGVWTNRYDGPGGAWDTPVSLAVDGSANVYVTGRSDGSGTGRDYATIKYDAKGNQLWVSRFNGRGNGDDSANALALDSAGNVYVTGSSYVYFRTEYATVKYDANGNQLWVARYIRPGVRPDNEFDAATSLAVDSAGNVYVTGKSFGSFSVNDDYVTIKYDGSGNQLWAARYHGGNYADFACALALDGAGNVYVTGGSHALATGYDYATVKYDANGNQLWVARYDGPGSGEDLARTLAVDLAGNVYVSGFSQGDQSLDDYATLKYVQEPVAGLPTIITQPKSEVVLPGANVRLSVSATGEDPLGYNWRFNGVNLSGATNASLLLTNVQSGDAGDYSVIITNRVGTTVSPEARLAVVSQPRLDLTQTLPSVEVRFTLTGDADRSYEIQYSSNLTSWTSLTNSFNPAGQIQFADTTASNASARFYRALTRP